MDGLTPPNGPPVMEAADAAHGGTHLDEQVSSSQLTVDQLQAFYAEHDPSSELNAEEVKSLLAQYTSSELDATLTAKYGVSPVDGAPEPPEPVHSLARDLLYIPWLVIKTPFMPLINMYDRVVYCNRFSEDKIRSAPCSAVENSHIDEVTENFQSYEGSNQKTYQYTDLMVSKTPRCKLPRSKKYGSFSGPVGGLKTIKLFMTFQCNPSNGLSQYTASDATHTMFNGERAICPGLLRRRAESWLAEDNGAVWYWEGTGYRQNGQYIYNSKSGIEGQCQACFSRICAGILLNILLAGVLFAAFFDPSIQTIGVAFFSVIRSEFA
jgi:hypothetical protein